MSEGDIRPWGEGEPPHGWVCRFCGKVITAPNGCERGAHGLHHRSLEATARWHRVIEEVTAVSEASARGDRRGTFVVKIDLNDDHFAGPYKERDLEIAAILRSVSDRLMRGQYTPDDRNRLSIRASSNTVGFFRFKEES